VPSSLPLPLLSRRTPRAPRRLVVIAVDVPLPLHLDRNTFLSLVYVSAHSPRNRNIVSRSPIINVNDSLQTLPRDLEHVLDDLARHRQAPVRTSAAAAGAVNTLGLAVGGSGAIDIAAVGLVGGGLGLVAHVLEHTAD
jgi:hypothetical protein